MMSSLDGMSNKELVDLYNKMAETAGLRGKEVTQVKKFKDHATAVTRTRKLGEWIAATGNGKMTEPEPREKKEKEPRPRKSSAVKEPFGDDLVIIEVAENKRFKNTISHRHYEEMARYMEKHPDASVDEVISSTSYRRQDFDHDLRVGSIKTRKK